MPTPEYGIWRLGFRKSARYTEIVSHPAMSQRLPLLDFPLDCQTAVALAICRLTAAGLRVKRSFELDSACAPFTNTRCPHSGEIPCDCKLVVLIVGNAETGSIPLVFHDCDGRTELLLEDIMEDPSQQILKDRIVREFPPPEQNNLENKVDKPPIDEPAVPSSEASTIETRPSTRRARASLKDKLRKRWAILALLSYLFGLGSGFFIHVNLPAKGNAGSVQTTSGEHEDMATLLEQINPSNGFKLPANYGDIGPRLLAAGAIDFAPFVQLYKEIGQPLSIEQMNILEKGSDAQIVIDRSNAQFLLNLFWAVGLANQNRLLTEGPMMQNGREQVVNFASTSGWTLAARSIPDLYASTMIIQLTKEQQALLEEVAQAVYRPCCDNPTHFPDCNHGMAMLGLLELMASQGASVGAMFEAAKYVNAFWFPQQTVEVAMVIKAVKNLDFVKADARSFVGRDFSSGSGFQSVHQWLVQNGKLDQAPQGGGSCGVR